MGSINCGWSTCMYVVELFEVQLRCPKKVFNLETVVATVLILTFQGVL